MKSLEGGRLLIVDDEAPQMRALCETLASEGYQTRGFASPLEALGELRAGEYDLLLTGLMMPGLDAIDLITAVGRIDPQIGTVVLTGHGTIDTAVQAMRRGALDYIVKPFSLDAALPVISRAMYVVHRRRANAALQEQERRRDEELAAAYADLESFAYSISHDLRAPLIFVKDFAQRLQEDYAAQLDEEGRHIVQIIHDGSVSLDQMIVGLLAFSRSTRQPLELEPLDMASVVRAAVAEACALRSDTAAIFELGPLPAALGDPTVIRHVWSNLIGNALKFSAARSPPRIIISGRIEGGEALYAVQDNGVGFDVRYAHKLFGVFKRLHSAEEFPGTGVGLAIVHRIVVRHGGRIWAESAPDAGATFHFTLPAAQLEQQAAV